MEGQTRAPATATSPDANRPEIIVVGKGEAFAPRDHGLRPWAWQRGSVRTCWPSP